ncbi:NitT/TauT family transport system substrate-binding protein [Geomicrobium halophilum]|uniref:NitT/TauT family transport system substrate-binding protein n=1 Tax=Geomicrobium halophilum TaxID=549000 RepID=A0A841PMS8_9BACL|nr:ABC transporter substrate-binding protein [Geomicrobium halophilum]MBB6450049.1 NitT/TauT family transport system substrate-binding protein [Geomicrobium halophilum]
MKKSIAGMSAFLLLTLAGCNASEENAEEITIGYFPNFTHITTVIALENGYFEEEFGSDINIETSTFPDGGAFMEAMSTQDVDIGTVGPSPATQNFQLNPEHEIVAGAVNGGAVLATRENSGIESLSDLEGTRVAIPTIGSTQDIMLRATLMEEGMDVEDSGGTVRMLPQEPADTSTLFLQEDVDAAATQEPWGVYLENQANADILLDEEEFAWGTESTTTVVAARNAFTEGNPDLTEEYLRAHIRAVEFIEENQEEAVEAFINHIEEITGNELDFEETLEASNRLNPTYEVNEEILQEMATISYEADYAQSDDIEGLVNLDYLEAALQGEE